MVYCCVKRTSISQEKTNSTCGTHYVGRSWLLLVRWSTGTSMLLVFLGHSLALRRKIRYTYFLGEDAILSLPVPLKHS